MALDNLLQKKRAQVIKKIPSTQVLNEVESGKRFVVVEDAFDTAYVPRGYTLINMDFKGDKFRTLVPQSLLFYMANPGEGNPDSALDDLADFYADTKGFEEDMITDSAISVQGANWATLGRSAYHTYLINKLVSSSSRRDTDGEPIPEFNLDTLRALDLTDNYVANRVKAMAAISLEKTLEEIKEYDIGDVLKHITFQEDKIQKMTQGEFNAAACYAGSHYELRSELMKDFTLINNVGYGNDQVYRRNDGLEEIRIRKEIGSKTQIGTIRVFAKQEATFNSTVESLEEQIHAYRLKKHGNVGRHDSALIRQYTNLKYIAPEKPNSQLDTMPPIKEER